MSCTTKWTCKRSHGARRKGPRCATCGGPLVTVARFRARCGGDVPLLCKQLTAAGVVVRSRGRAIFAWAELGEATDSMLAIVDAYLFGGAA